jgi:hypothetical protein
MNAQFKQGQNVKTDQNANDMSINSEDKTHIAKIPINIPPEHKN